MLPRIETSQVIRRATKMFRDHNQRCPLNPHTRNRAGSAVEINRRKGLIPESVTTTFYTILSEYIHNYNYLRTTLPSNMQDINSLPSVWTNSKRIGKIARCSDRTVRNHLTLLRELKLITTQNHGRKKSFELWVDPQFLFEKAPISAAPSLESTEKFSANLYQGHLKKDKENAAIHVLHGDDIKQGHEERTDQGEIPNVAAPDGIKIQGCGAAAGADSTPQLPENEYEEAEFGKPVMPAGADGKPLAYDFVLMLAEFWMYAQKVIYPGKVFKKSQQEKALVAIRDGVYGGFSFDLDPEEWERYHVRQMEKAYRAGKYLASHPDAWAAFPYGIKGSGKGYFDRENTNGFAGTEKWIAQEEKQRRRQNKLAKLKQAKADFENLQAGKRLRKPVAGMSHDELFDYHRRLFASYGRIWEDRFVQQYNFLKQRNFISPVQRAIKYKFK
ncbi:hypothetical protein ACWKW6_12890 [Dyadobacter jiangsuensis]